MPAPKQNQKDKRLENPVKHIGKWTVLVQMTPTQVSSQHFANMSATFSAKEGWRTGDPKGVCNKNVDTDTFGIFPVVVSCRLLPRRVSKMKMR